MQAKNGRPVKQVDKSHERLAVSVVCSQFRQWKSGIFRGIYLTLFSI